MFLSHAVTYDLTNKLAMHLHYILHLFLTLEYHSMILSSIMIYYILTWHILIWQIYIQWTHIRHETECDQRQVYWPIGLGYVRSQKYPIDKPTDQIKYGSVWYNILVDIDLLMNIYLYHAIINFVYLCYAKTTHDIE